MLLAEVNAGCCICNNSVVWKNLYLITYNFYFLGNKVYVNPKVRRFVFISYISISSGSALSNEKVNKNNTFKNPATTSTIVWEILVKFLTLYDVHFRVQPVVLKYRQSQRNYPLSKIMSIISVLIFLNSNTSFHCTLMKNSHKY